MSVSMNIDMSMDMSTIGDETIDFNRSINEQAIDEDTKKEVLALLKSRSITEIKDYLLDVNRRLSETEEQFNDQLKIHYTVILKVIQDIAALHGQLSDIDNEFRDLCFNDDSYQIHKLPNFEPVSLQNSTIVQEEEQNSKNNTLPNVTLRVSNWILAVTNFIDRFTNSNENSSLFFDDMLKNTIDLSTDDSTQYERYQTIIRNKSMFLQKYIVDSLFAHKIQLKLTQNIQLFNLFHDTVPFYQWDPTITDQYNDILYDMILEEYDIEALYGKDKTASIISSPVVQAFLQSPIFRNTVIEKLVTNIEDQLNQLESTKHMEEMATDSSETKLVDTNDQEDKEVDEEISEIINDSIMQSMGLISERGVSTYQSIQTIIHKLSNLEDIGADTTRVQSLRQRLLDCLQKHELQAQNDANNEHTGTSTDETVQQILNNYNKGNLEQLMKKQIVSLQH
ncbi:hypothetical protein C6P45_001869 [Maudiozyma exigua]|uniref:Uncharacterized protein n=1 Tax=Maudiozyma exigua TaxID=34358 RepID=A0A9P6VZD6_MAUEX|nr:hypothetical protein C6P45_001869 [Kazachstania exigua]